MTSDAQKRHGGQTQTVLDLLHTINWTTNSTSGLWSPKILPSLVIASSLSTGWRISTLEADRVLHRLDRSGWFISMFSHWRIGEAAQGWLQERRGPSILRTWRELSGLRLLSCLRAENRPSSERWRVIARLFVTLAGNIHVKLWSFCKAYVTLSTP